MELPSSLFEYIGNGTITFENEHTLQAQFKIKLLSNGKIEGNIEFPYLHPRIFEFVKGMIKFSLKGRENNIGYHISADSCVFENLSENTIHNEITVKGIFTTKNVVIYIPDLSNQKLDKEILLDFGITNVHRIPTTNVESELGFLSLANYEGIEEKQKYMEIFKTPLITSSIRIVTKMQDDRTLDDLITNTIVVVENFLKITSFSQGVLHDWAFLSVYINSTNLNTIQHQILRSPVLKTPSFKLLMPYPYSNEFVQASFKGYTKELDAKYGFNAALEWYLDSNADAAIETNFLDASTCLELLMDNLLSEGKRDMILSDEDFKIFYKEICKSAGSILGKLGKDDKTINAVNSSLKQAQRISFANKICLLVNYWGIKMEDTRIKVQDIRDVRNEITHTGRYPVNNDTGIEKLIRVNNGLQTLLTRVFLAMLRYDRHYQDYGVQHNSNGKSSEWINFKEVCSKIGNPGFDSD